MPTPQTEEYRTRLLKRLALIVSEDQTYRIRLAATAAVQKMLAPDNPMRLEAAADLLDRALPSWASRLYLIGGRGVMRKVSRPPTSITDVWS